jgi:hypothetical protein
MFCLLAVLNSSPRTRTAPLHALCRGYYLHRLFWCLSYGMLTGSGRVIASDLLTAYYTPDPCSERFGWRVEVGVCRLAGEGWGYWFGSKEVWLDQWNSKRVE